MQKTQHWKTIGNCWVFINNKLLIRAVTNQSANRYSVLPKFVVKDLTFRAKVVCWRELMSDPNSKSSGILSDGSGKHIFLKYDLKIAWWLGKKERCFKFILIITFGIYSRWKTKLYVGNSSVVKIYIKRPKPGPVAKNATPRQVY